MRVSVAAYSWRNRLTRVSLAIGGLLWIAGALPAQESDAPAPPDTLTGQWAARAAIEQRGIRPFAVLTSEVWGNVAGGLRTGGWYNQLLDFGVELDTAKLGWWPGGSLFAQAHWVENSRTDVTFSDYTGAFNPISGIQSGNHLRVFNLYYQHSWREGAYVLKAGQLAADDDFMKSDYAGLFVNSAFGAMPSQVGTPLASALGNPAPFPIFPVAAPGLLFRAQLSQAGYTQLGLYCGRPGFDEPSNHGFDWVRQSTAELGLFWENGYQYSIGRLPGGTRLGLSYHTGPVDDFSASAGGGEAPATTQSVPNFYLVEDVQLLSDQHGKCKVGLFCRGGITPQPDRSMVAAYADGGLNWFGPVPGRGEDVAGLALSYTRFGTSFRQSTGPDGVAADETTLEATYSARLTRWMTLQADAQFLFNPAVNPESNSRQAAAVLGMRAQISF